MKFSRTWILSALLLAIAVAVGIWLYPQMPTRVATHFDAHGNPNGWSPRWLAACLPAFAQLGIMILTWLLPVISPRRFKIEPFGRVYRGLMLVIQAAVLVVGVCAALKGAAYQVPLATIAPLAIGVLFMVLGNYMGKLRKNFFIGIRTPWTIASTGVWERTHRLGGWLLMLAGVVWVIDALVGADEIVLGAAVIVFALVSVAYSFVVYKRLERRGKLEEENG